MKDLKMWLDGLKEIGISESGGVTRLAYSQEEDSMHEKISEFCKKEGLNTVQDKYGNTYIYLHEDRKEYTLIGSHLDSVPNGGRYDGVAGVLSGLLILKWIKENNLDIPLMVAAFRAEEGSIFGRATMGSSLALGKISEEELKKISNGDGKSLCDVLEEKGFLQNEFTLPNIKRYFEIHIEQGRVLWDKNIDLGIVTSIAGPRRFKLKIEGRQDHSGATPMNMRKDALCAGAEIILNIEKYANEEMINSSVGTVGMCEISPNAMNVVPGEVNLGIDIRGVKKESIDKIIGNVKKCIQEVTSKRGLNYDIKEVYHKDPVKLDIEIVEGLEKKAKSLNLNFNKMPSGAGHDAMVFATKYSTGMIFIPNKDGISHSPKEEIRIEDLHRASKFLYEYIKEEE